MTTGEVRDVETKKVMFVETIDAPSAIEEAFEILRAKCPGLIQREFFGAHFKDKYWAAVEMSDEDDPERIGLNVGEIPGGPYACKRLDEWKVETLSHDLPENFKSLTEERDVDDSRPFVEYYPNPNELILEAPVIEH
jgi:hypothetical protein